MTPRPYQIECHDAVWAFLCARKDDPVAVLPTGAGKTICIAMDCRKALSFDGRVIVLAHRKELLEQNAAEIQALIPEERVGIYSAGLNRRETDNRILVAGIQSIYDKAHEIGMRHLCIVDEAHLCPTDGEGMYRTFFNDLGRYCQNRKVGYTATPYRLDCGPLCGPDRLFSRVAYSAPVRQLIADGYLCPLTTESSRTEYDTTTLHVRGGEFVSGEMAELFGDAAKIKAACEEIVARTLGRRSILVFCAGVHHAGAVADELSRLTGDVVGCVTGETDALTRAASLAAFKGGRLRFLTNCDVLTTGFNARNIDAIAVLRATLSPGLFAQMVGRGLRTHEAKVSTLILDFGENFRRHGALDDPTYGVKSTGSSPDSPGEVPLKTCPGCRAEVHAAAMKCPACGLDFPPRELKHGTSPDNAPALVEPETFDVVSWSFQRWQKKGVPPGSSPDTLRVDYGVRRKTGGNLSAKDVAEWVCLEHGGFARSNAEKWWRQHSLMPIPETIDGAIAYFDAELVGMPTQITTVIDDKGYQRITDRIVGTLPEPVAPADKFSCSNCGSPETADVSGRRECAYCGTLVEEGVPVAVTNDVETPF